MAEGECISRLRKDLLAEKKAALKLFWQTTKETGTPFIERIHGDAGNALCTFIFEGDESTESVLVNLPPFSRLLTEDFQMSRIDGTSVWFATVKLPTASRFVYSFSVNCPHQKVDPESSKEMIGGFQASLQADELNRDWLNEKSSYVETPNAKQSKYLDNESLISRGNVERLILENRFGGKGRAVSVYTPPNYDALKEYPLLVLFDEDIYLKEIKAPSILDGLFAENMIPPMIAVFVSNPKETRSDELVCNPHFSDFISLELLKWIKESYRITDDANGTIIGGASFGGLAAVFTALCHPTVFGKILSQSGSFWRDPLAIHTKLSNHKTSGQKFYLDAGVFEIEPRNGTSLLEANRALSDILRRKGFALNYQEFRGGHGAVNWRTTFSDGLIFLTSDLIEREIPVGNLNLF